MIEARRTNLDEAVLLDVDSPGRPELRMEVAGRGLLLLRQAGAAILLAEVDPRYAGVDYVLTGQFRSPIPPIRAGSPKPPMAWAHYFASALTETSTGPLHAGRWAISTTATDIRADQVLPQPRGGISWFGPAGGWEILPLRPLPSPTAARVKAYRKRTREGALPPLLLWWISGLDCHVLLDGHDRLAAALAEQQSPPLLALSSISRPRATRNTQIWLDAHERTTHHIERQAAAGSPGATDALLTLNQQLARDLQALETARGTTRAWPLPGGTAAWRHAHALAAEGAGRR
ncbi:hypothetical protein AB0J83_39290 [Actinoplanes sp. NPDC049596]|uniref:hypothetical protein n=1 Tax=unclassified Actinoplanes TaxID=2626549 RepID=UPI00341BC663